MTDDANRGVGVFGLGLEGDRFDAVDEGGDADPGVDEAEVGDDDSGSGAGDLVCEVADALVDVGPAVLGVEDVVGGGHGRGGDGRGGVVMCRIANRSINESKSLEILLHSAEFRFS